ncbi:MAG: DMT family transporter [Bacteroidales bacterium]|nr:DMT family transporter [Bacteroidales bacterium]
MKKALPYILIIIAEIFWGLSFIWTKVLINLEIPVFVFTFSRMFIAALVMLVLCKSFGVLQRIDRKDIPSFLLCALLHPFLYYICETFSLKATGSPTLCALFSSLVPVFVMIAALVFFKTKITWKGFAGAVLSIVGIVLMNLGKGEVSSKYWWGFALLFGCLIASVGYNTIVQKNSSKYNAWTITTYQFVFGSIFLFPCIFIEPMGLSGMKLLLNAEVIVPLLCLAVLCSCAAFAFFVNGVGAIGMTKTAIFNTIIPVVSALVAFSMGMESFTIAKLIGVVIIIASVELVQRQ